MIGVGVDHEISSTFEEYIACFEPHPEIKSLADIVEWNKKHADEAMPDRKFAFFHLVFFLYIYSMLGTTTIYE
jgi:hypothetical protein